MTRLTDTQRVEFLCWLAREHAPIDVLHDYRVPEAVQIRVKDKREGMYTVGTGVTFADAVDSAAMATGWPR